MTDTQLRLDDAARRATPLGWERQVRPLLDALQRGAPRAALIGAAGSGKSASLTHLSELFARQSRDVVLLEDSRCEDVDPAQVLIVDDLQLLAPEQLDALVDRVEDPAAGLVIARRPWPAPSAVRRITRRLEQRTPAVVLGHVSRSDVLDHLAARGADLADACIAHILDATRGLSWLVSAALQHHDARDCAHDGDHDELDSALAELIAFRLDDLDDDLRRVIEEASLTAPGRMRTLPDASDSDAVMQGFAHGMMLRSGEVPPLVGATVRQALSSQRYIELCSRHPEGLEDLDRLPPARDRRIADALITHGDRLLTADPGHAADLYAAAADRGADAAALLPRRLRATWSAGDLERASRLVDAAIATEGAAAHCTVGVVSAALWSSRAMMSQADAVHRIAPPVTATDAADAAIARFGIGERDVGESPVEREALPSTLGVAMDLLRTGMVATLEPDCTEEVLPGLVRAAEMYTSSGAADAISEIPAVITAIVALNLGRPATAQAVLDDAIAGGHAGAWAQPRLLLWRAWVAVQRAHPGDARELLARAFDASAGPPPVRDALLAHAVRVALARRYDDAAGLENAWHEARATLLRADVDLYLLHPLAELVSAATRSGDAARVESHLTRGLEIVSRLGDPPVWAPHIRWAGIQQGILLSSPPRLAPHAKALVAASGRSRVAAGMARAGRVWTAVLSGSVDADAVVSAAEGLAAIGLMWDAARLAGHGAARTDDRRIATQLLACARELHPTDGTRRIMTSADGGDAGEDETAAEEVLSEREIEVARLVLQGKTYAEIGEAIFISPRTAEHHIAHIRRRLGANSRSEVLAKLRRLLGGSTVDAGHGSEPP